MASSKKSKADEEDKKKMKNSKEKSKQIVAVKETKSPISKKTSEKSTKKKPKPNASNNNENAKTSSSSQKKRKISNGDSSSKDSLKLVIWSSKSAPNPENLQIESSKSVTPKKQKKKEEEENGGGQQEDGNKSCRFPMNRVKRLMKKENSSFNSANDAVFLVNKATEMFLKTFCGDAYELSILDRKKFLHYKHLSSAVSKDPKYGFLSDSVPQKIKAEEALAQMKSTELGGQ